MKKILLLSLFLCISISSFASPDRVATDKTGFSGFDIFMIVVGLIIGIPCFIGAINSERKHKKH